MLPADADVNRFFDLVVADMQSRLDYTEQAATELVHEYYTRFRDPEYCRQIRVAVQDDDSIFHEGVGGMALRVHYYLGLKENPDHMSFVRWRAEFQKRAAR
jgi:hypothetical protein